MGKILHSVSKKTGVQYGIHSITKWVAERDVFSTEELADQECTKRNIIIELRK